MEDIDFPCCGLQTVEAENRNGISGQSSWVLIIFYQLINIHLLHILGHHSGQYPTHS